MDLDVSGCAIVLVGLFLFSFAISAIERIKEFYLASPVAFYVYFGIISIVIVSASYLYSLYRKRQMEILEREELAREEREKKELEEARIKSEKALLESKRESLLSAVDRLIGEAEFLKSPAGKTSRYRKAQELLEKELSLTDFPEEFATEISGKLKEVTLMISKTEVGKVLEAARKNEFTGNSKKAFALYKEALYLLLNDDVPDDEQEDLIEEIKGKIAELEKK